MSKKLTLVTAEIFGKQHEIHYIDKEYREIREHLSEICNTAVIKKMDIYSLSHSVKYSNNQSLNEELNG